MVADLETSVRAVVESGQLHRWLDAMASNGLNRWSANNRLLATVQVLRRGEPIDNLHMMGFRQWETINRKVGKGAKAVWILAPVTRTVVEDDDIDTTTEQRRIVGFKGVPVFNISDTHGEPLPTPPARPAAGAVTPGTLDGLRDRVATAGYTYGEVEIPSANPVTGEGTLGYTDPRSKQIVVDARLDDAQKASTIAHHPLTELLTRDRAVRAGRCGADAPALRSRPFGRHLRTGPATGPRCWTCCWEAAAVGEHVDAVAFLTRGARPSRKRSAEHDFLTPSLPTPAIARPTVWTASQQSGEEVLGVVEAFEADASSRKELLRRLRGVEVVLAWLRQSPGESWQQRWLDSGADTAGRAWSDLVDYADTPPDPGTRRGLATGAVGRLILAEVIRPSYAWLYAYQSTALYLRFEQRRDQAGFAAMAARCDTDRRLRVADRRDAFVQLARILMHNGGALADITLADCVEAYRGQTAYSAHAHSYWFTLLHEEGILPRDAPQTLHAASRRGQLTVEEIVGGYGIVCRPIRDLFVDYLRERQPGWTTPPSAPWPRS